MDILDVIRATWDVAAFRDEPVDEATLRDVLETLRWTPSAANTQPWEVYVVQDPERKRALDRCLLDAMMTAATGGTDVSEAPAALVLALDVKRAGARYGEIGRSLLGVQDAAVALAHLRLAAAERGLRTRWIREVELNDAARALGMPRSHRAVALIVLGWGDPPDGGAPVMPVDDWLHLL